MTPPYGVALVCSNGGHLAHLLWLKDWWSAHPHFWVSFDTPDARDSLANEDVVWAHHPTNRSLINLAKNARLAHTVLGERRPELIVTSGAGVGVPFAWVGAAMGIPVIYLEVYDRIHHASLSARLVRPVATRMVIQWEAQKGTLPESCSIGRPL